MSKRAGFTLIEVMITSMILVLGTVLIHESYLRLADLYSRHINTLKVRLWMNEQIWNAQESLLYAENASTDSQEGNFDSNTRVYSWSQKIQALSEPDLYKIDLTTSWNEGNRPVSLAKEIYVFKKEPGAH